MGNLPAAVLPLRERFGVVIDVMRSRRILFMIIATLYTVDYDEARDVYKIRNMESPFCPDCGMLLSGYDTRRRHVVESSGAVLWFKLRRLKCSSCNKLHLELPDFMVPKKHYEAKVIKDVLCGHPDSCPADDSTIRRWKLGK